MYLPLTFVAPYTALVELIHMLVELRNWLFLDFHGLDSLRLHPLNAVGNIRHLYVMLRLVNCAK